MKKTARKKFLFRGTTLGWQGNHANIHLPRTSVTTHPVKAVLFALSCNAHNKIILISTTDNIGSIPRDENVLAPIEDEIAFEITPNDYAATCDGYLEIEDAINILKDLKLDIPQLLDRTLFDMALKDVAKIDLEMMKKFYELAKPKLKQI